MIALREQYPQFTPSEYLAWEEQQEFSHEFIDGEIYAMTGGSLNHSRIGINLSITIKTHLRGSQCQVFNSDAKVQIIESNSFCYPDISVTCNLADLSASQFISHPCLIIEVLSPSTEAYDRGKKFRLYRRSVSLQEYVLVSTTDICVDVYQRNDFNQWVLTTYGSGDLVEFKSLNLSIPVEQIYEDVVFSAEQ